jgi:metal-responsive CopG/Arc/MetJ family transcriptional regulator
MLSYNQDMKTKPVSVTIPENLIREVKQMAEREGRSFSNMLTQLVAEGVKNKAA